MVWNRDSHWAKGLVNLNQTPEQRKAKYRRARELGATVAWAMRMRDWHMPKIERALGVK